MALIMKKLHLVCGAAALCLTNAALAQDIPDLPFGVNPTNTLFSDRLKVNFYAAQGYQYLQATDGAFRPQDEQQTNNFLRLRANLMLSFQVTEDIRAYVDFGEEPNDFSNNDEVNFDIQQDFGGIDFELFGLSGNRKENESLILSIGNIGMSTFQFRGFQDGADSQNNPLIGNSPIDFATAESGAQIAYNKVQSNHAIKRWRASFSLSGSDFGEVFQEGVGHNIFATVTVETKWGWDFGVNFQQANQGDQLDFVNGVASLDGVVRANWRFGDGDNYNFSSSATSSRETHVGLSPGLNLQTLTLNARYRPTQNTTILGQIGTAADDFSFINAQGEIVANQAASGNEPIGVIRQESKINYFLVEAQQYLIPEKFYLAARYTHSQNVSDDIDSEDTLSRLQIGAGYWVNNWALVKLEYVNQDEEANSGGQIGSGFDGFHLEASVKF